ncbi:MAG: acyl-CoA thioesterase [Clostridiales bacterium]|nr:acyl-CoA thioesterase [Clostridiales bacterium]
MEIKPYIHNAKYYETDQMAIVHHSNYIRWFEEARVDWMAQVGIPFREVEARGIVVPVVSVSAQYKTMTHFDDTVSITVKLTYYNSVRFKFRYEVRDADTGELRATGESEHCLLDKAGRVISLRRKAPDFHQRFADNLEPEE